jgi:hypothetical protein
MKQHKWHTALKETLQWIFCVLLIQLYIYMAIAHDKSIYFLIINLLIGFFIIFFMINEVD